MLVEKVGERSVLPGSVQVTVTTDKTMKNVKKGAPLFVGSGKIVTEFSESVVIHAVRVQSYLIIC